MRPAPPAALSQPVVLAAAPRRRLVMAGRPWQVRWYYDLWTLLPRVQRGPWGRGEPHETALVPGARVIIHPRTAFADLLRRGARCVTGAARIERARDLDCSADRTRLFDRTRLSDRTAIIRHRPGMLPRPGMLRRVGCSLSVAVFARLRASRARARGDWDDLRDTDRHTVTAMACHARIPWVDPPISPAALPRSATHYSLRPEISGCWGDNTVNVFYGTDGYVAGSRLVTTSLPTSSMSYLEQRRRSGQPTNQMLTPCPYVVKA